MSDLAKVSPSIHEDCFDGATEIYVRGPSWPSTVNVNDAPNPWSKQHWNLTRQVQIFRHDQAEANRLARAAGHKETRSVRVSITPDERQGARGADELHAARGDPKLNDQ